MYLMLQLKPIRLCHSRKCPSLSLTLYVSLFRCEKCGRNLHKECIALSPKCGRSGGPPRLPPRPPSMQLPTPNAAANAFHNRFSSISIDEAEKPSSLLLR